ncbi:MAG: hypothetical protein V5B44_05260 [Candidatus Accumulibacter necessarius]|jgi:hypothetical protein|uniref:hypothetical protein n=1 Tax=Candidatus Accumulibacter necessarius TaxID=2954386 RepID=UPI002FC30686
MLSEAPQLIVEEVSRLNGLGYEHVILISNHYGNRRINRSAQRHSPHTQTTFLDEVATNFPDVSLYMLRRDVFPATRLHNRARAESAFEAVRLSDHNDFAIMQGDGVVKQLVPAFTFGTLAVVGNDDAARPQSGFCTYFLDTDYQVRNAEWRERVRSNIMSTSGVRQCLLTVLRGLHFLEAEKQPDGGLFKPVLDPFSWVQPSSSGAAGEVQVAPPSRRKGDVLLSLPALLSHVTDAPSPREGLMLDKLQQYSLWGQAFEIAVKRGVLLALLASDIRKPEKMGLEPWMDIGTADVYGVLARELKEVDPNLKARSRENRPASLSVGDGTWADRHAGISAQSQGGCRGLHDPGLMVSSATSSRQCRFRPRNGGVAGSILGGFRARWPSRSGIDRQGVPGARRLSTMARTSLRET